MTHPEPGETPSSAYRRELWKPASARAVERETTFDDITEPWDGFPDGNPPRDVRTNPANPTASVGSGLAPDEVPTEADTPYESIEPALSRSHGPSTGSVDRSALPVPGLDPDDVSTEPLPAPLLAGSVVLAGSVGTLTLLVLVASGLAWWTLAGAAPSPVEVTALGF